MTRCKDIFAVPPFPNKAVMHNWRFFIKAGKAATGPPVGQEFSKIGLKVMDFVKSFNDRTKPLFKDDIDLIVRIQVYFDKSYIYRIEPPPVTWFIMRAVRKKRGQTGNTHDKGYFTCLMTLEMCYEIAKMKQFN
uniref:Large ribosomal subunit protein uL11m n=1 Tax=Lygus hesperus TaxID=30085 RepID=A0A0A9WML1_LYGHE